MTLHKQKLPLIVALLISLCTTPAVWATPSFEFATNLLHLPVVSVPGSGHYQATLLLNGNQFVLQSAPVASSSEIANEAFPASYDANSGILSVPTVNVIFEDNVIAPYSANFQLVVGSNPLVFDLTHVAPLQDPVTNTLQNFNVNTSPGGRIDPDGNPLPDNYSPLGASFQRNKTDELFLVGIEVDLPESTAAQAAFVELSAKNIDPPISYDTEVLNVPSAEHSPWPIESYQTPSTSRTLRAATGADLNGDGLEETVVAYIVNEAGANRLKITHFSDKVHDFSAQDGGTLSFADDVRDISISAGDFNGDGRSQIAIALSTSTGVELLFANYQEGVFTLDTNASKSLSASLSNAALYTSLETGNIDYDNPHELALVITELATSDTGISRYYIFDDQNTGYAQLATSSVQGADDIGIIKTAVVADVSLGDIDGDGLDEIVFGGLSNISSGGGCKDYGHLLFALDDKTHNLNSLGSKFFSHFFRNCPAHSAWRLRYLHINTVDLDGDHIAEIQANQFVYNNFKVSEPWTELYTLPQELIFDHNDFGFFDKSTSAMEASDVTGDGRQNIVFYNQNRTDLVVWGDEQLNGWSQIAAIPVQFKNAQQAINPIIAPVNLDQDGPVLKYADSEYRLVFTEPLLIAALAAAPCAQNIGQQIDDCRTRYGTARTVSVDAESALTLSASVHVGSRGGVNIFGISAEVEKIKTTTVAVTGSILAAYSLEQSVIFTSGALQDSVIFTTIPLDQYTYTIASHPIPELIGQQVVISLPRKPITIMTNLDFYNQSIGPDGLFIGNNVFQHTPGNLDSYPTEADKNRLTNQYFDSVFDVIQNSSSALRDALNILELESDVQSVDQGTGSREVTLTVNQAFGVGVGTEISRDVAVSGEAAGFVAGFSVGASLSANLSISKGTSTIYAGSVGAIDAGNFAANSYNYGLFAYTFQDTPSGQEFEVINYWVERTGR